MKDYIISDPGDEQEHIQLNRRANTAQIVK